MRRAVSVILVLVATVAVAMEAPSAFQPPAGVAKAVGDGLDASTVDRYLDRVAVIHEYQGFQGRNARLKADSQSKAPLKVGEWFAVQLASDAYYAETFQEDGLYVHSAALRSLDALALRVQVDLSRLAPGDDVWVLDPVTEHAFGPFTRADHHSDGFWLPTIQGDTAVIVARSVVDRLPDFEILGASHHFFQLTDTKELSCHNGLDAIGNAGLLSLASGVGRIATSVSGSGTWLCTGTLINNPQTVALEPYLLTANHCVATQTEVVNSEVIWDYRSPGSLAALPRSNGSSLLATSSSLDMTLLLLNSVPNGEHGRTYAGWNSNVPATASAVSSIHHPGGSYMRVSFGKIEAIGVSVLSYVQQIRVGWDSGMTEGGSSGSGLFNAANQIIGTLSSGAAPVCDGGPTFNYDFYASFRMFYPQIQQYVNNTTPPLPQPPPLISCAATRGAHGAVAGDLAIFALAAGAVLAIGVLREARLRTRAATRR